MKKFHNLHWLLVTGVVSLVFFVAFGCGDDDGEVIPDGGEVSTDCPETQTLCGEVCADLQSSPDHCGACDEGCTYANGTGACAEGECFLVACAEDFENCDGDVATGCEADFNSDTDNCGACGDICGIAQVCNAGTCAAGGTIPATWKITSLGTDNCVANPGHEGITGDDNGGIATGRKGFYYNGDDQLAGFSYDTAYPTVIGTEIVDGIFSDLATGELYSLTVIDALVDGCNAAVDGIVRLNPDTLEVIGTATSLSTSIDSCGVGGNQGVFAGMGMVIVHNGTNAYEITIADGTVTDLGTGADLSGVYGSENWADWGVAERFGGETYLVFRYDDTYDAIIRRAVSDGTDEVILDIDALETATSGEASDMATISVDFSRNVWVYHAEDMENMLGVPDVDSEEVVGVCPAVLQYPVN
jgi:hypothetical protein